MLADRSADAEVKRIDHLSFVLDLLAFETNIGDPVLAAAVRAAGHVQLELLVEAGKTPFQFFYEPPRKALGFADGQLAELGTRAGDGSAPEGRAIDMQSDLFELVNQLSGLCLGDVDEKQVLHDGRTKLAIAVALCELRCGSQLRLGAAWTALRAASADECRH